MITSFLEDKCVDSKTVEESLCDKNQISSLSIKCPEGTTCVSGQCVNDKEEVCIDSDGGQEPLLYGIVKMIDKGVITSFLEDTCVDTEAVEEGFCSKDKINHKPFRCPRDTHCVSGQCVNDKEEVCIDSDGGNESYIAGIVTYIERGSVKRQESDSCNNSTLTEWICNGINPKGIEVTCKKGCKSGVCRWDYEL